MRHVAHGKAMKSWINIGSDKPHIASSLKYHRYFYFLFLPLGSENCFSSDFLAFFCQNKQSSKEPQKPSLSELLFL